MTSAIYTPRLRSLRPVLRQWISCNRKLAYRWEEYDDAPWWYNERASVSVLAGAIWKAGGYAFEEFVGEKRVMERRKRFSSGRFDLEFGISDSLFIAEAKQCWLPSTRRQDHFERVSDSMDEARDDVRRCEPDGIQRLAIVFGVPYLTWKSQRHLDDSIKLVLDHAYDVDADAMAWMFPRMERPPTSKEGSAYPGVIVWIKEVKR